MYSFSSIDWRYSFVLKDFTHLGSDILFNFKSCLARNWMRTLNQTTLSSNSTFSTVGRQSQKWTLRPTNQGHLYKILYSNIYSKKLIIVTLKLNIWTFCPGILHTHHIIFHATGVPISRLNLSRLRNRCRANFRRNRWVV